MTLLDSEIQAHILGDCQIKKLDPTVQFEEDVKCFKERKERQKNEEEDTVDIETLTKKGYGSIIQEVYNPTSTHINPVEKIRNTFLNLYNVKANLKEKMTKQLDSLSNQRPFATNIKKQLFTSAIETKRSLSQGIYSLRHNAEKARLEKYKNVLTKSARFYYRTIFNLLKYEIPLSEALILFGNYMKSIIESGDYFKKEHFAFILKKIISEEGKIAKMTQAEIKFFIDLSKEMNIAETDIEFLTKINK